MIRLNFSILINAPAKKVWRTMLSDETYRIWTAVFCPGSHFVGDWSEGSKILFLGPDEKGEVSGMISRIEKSRPFEYMCIEHLGFYKDGVEDTSSEGAKSMAGAREIYSLEEDKGGVTHLKVEMDTAEEYSQMFDDIWPDSLKLIKELSEKRD